MNEFTSPNTLQALSIICCRATANTSVAQALSRWKMRASTCSGRNAAQQSWFFTRVSQESLRRGNRCVHCGFTYSVHRGISLLRCGPSLIVCTAAYRCIVVALRVSLIVVHRGTIGVRVAARRLRSVQRTQHAAFETTRANINAALAKAVRGVERWAYLWLSSLQRFFLPWRRCFWAC